MAPYLVSSDQSTRVLNKEYKEKYSFPQFVLLPWELRNQIWKFALQQRRLIRVSLREHPPRGMTEQESKQIRYGRPFLRVSGFHLLSKLLRVNSEARNAALEFYRVRLHCALSPRGLDDKTSHFGVFPFNPEHDILWFQDAYQLPDFFSAVAEHDHRRIGLCNIAIWLTNTEPHFSEPNVQCPKFIQAINNIREFYLITETNSYHVKARRERYNDFVSHSDAEGGPRMTQEFCPLMSSFPAFDLLPRDPRPIERDLVRLFLGFNNIVRGISDWRLMLEEWGLDPSQVESRILFMYTDLNPCLPTEDTSYDDPDQQRLRAPGTNRVLHQASPSSLAPDIHLTVEGQEAQERTDSVAFGFWMFPTDAFTQNTKSRHPHNTIDPWNLSDYWPELGLVHLPTGALS